MEMALGKIKYSFLNKWLWTNSKLIANTKDTGHRWSVMITSIVFLFHYIMTMYEIYQTVLTHQLQFQCDM